MKYVLCFVVFCSSVAQGAYSLQVGQDLRFQLASNGYSIHAVYPWTVKAGYLLGKWGFFAQYLSYVDQRDVVTNFSTQAAQSSALLWVRRGVVDEWGLFAGAGVGVYQSTVKTTFADESRRDYSKLHPQLSGELGWWKLFFARVTLEIVAQANVGQEVQPALTWGLGARVGVVF